jgi:regulatory protein
MSKSRAPRRVTPSSLDLAALYYLERFSASIETLRRVLMRRVERAARHHHADDSAAAMADGAAMVDALLRRYQAAGLLDDHLYAGAKTRSLLRRGASQRAIRQHLQQRGVEAELIDGALDDLAGELGEAGQPASSFELDLTAGLALARRRRLGPYRAAEDRASHRLRDLAALGRAGFSFEVAKAVVDGEAE